MSECKIQIQSSANTWHPTDHAASSLPEAKRLARQLTRQTGTLHRVVRGGVVISQLPLGWHIESEEILCEQSE